VQNPISIDGGWVVDVRYWGRPTPQRFYVGLGDPEAAVNCVRRAIKAGRGYTLHAFRRLSKTQAKLLRLKSGELRAT
jgi:hypothetical protein